VGISRAEKERQDLSYRLLSQISVNDALGGPLEMASRQLAKLARQWLLYSGFVFLALAGLSIVLFLPAADGLKLSGVDRALVSVIWAGVFYLLGFCVWQDLRLRHLKAEVELMDSINRAAIGHAEQLRHRLEL
jgi:hypothetical protein